MAAWIPDWNWHLSRLLAAKELRLVSTGLDKYCHSYIAFEPQLVLLRLQKVCIPHCAMS